MKGDKRMRKGLALFGFYTAFTPGVGIQGASLGRGLSLVFLSLVVIGGQADGTSGTSGTNGPPPIGGDCSTVSLRGS